MPCTRCVGCDCCIHSFTLLAFCAFLCPIPSSHCPPAINGFRRAVLTPFASLRPSRPCLPTPQSPLPPSSRRDWAAPQRTLSLLGRMEAHRADVSCVKCMTRMFTGPRLGSRTTCPRRSHRQTHLDAEARAHEPPGRNGEARTTTSVWTLRCQCTSRICVRGG